MTNSNSTIFVTLSSFAEYDPVPLDLIKMSGFPYVINTTGKRVTTQQLLDLGQTAAVVIAGVEPYDNATLDQLPALKCISRCGAGVDAVDLNAARQRGIAVLNTPDVPTEAVAELALTMMLSLSRNLTRQLHHARRHEWVRLETHLLAGKRVGLIGLGRIGRRVVELLAPFKVQLFASDPFADAAWAAAHAVQLTTLPELLATCDIVSLHAARSAQQPLFLGAAEIGSMKPGALFINLARGNMVDAPALQDALATGRLGGAGLDVYPEEPYSGPLCDLENVVLTPHSATLAVETRIAMETECVDKALRFLRGQLDLSERVV